MPLFTDYYFSTFSIATLVVVIQFLFVGLVFMIGKFFSNENLVGFAKHELGQAIFSILIIVSVISLIPFINYLFCLSLQESDYYNQGCSISDLSITAHVKVAREQLAAMYNNVRVLAKGTLRAFDWAATAGGASISVGLFSFNPFKYQGINAYIYAECFSILYKAMLFIKMQELFMILNAVYFFPYLFISGMIFRILPFTRKLGGLLMGISLGVFFVLPYMYILSASVFQEAGNFDTKFVLDTSQYAFMFITITGDVIDNNGQSTTFEDLMEKYSNENAKEGKDPFGMAMGNVVDQSTTSSKPPQYDYSILRKGTIPDPRGNSAFGSSLDYYNPKNPENHNYSLVEVVARIVLMATISSIFAIAGTISAIREISVLLGGDVEIAGLTKII